MSERQARLHEFDPSFVRHVFVPITHACSSKKGLSERLLRRRLERQGWAVWRGGLLHVVRGFDVFPNVRRRYEKLCLLLKKRYSKILPLLQYTCAVHHGMPDFICYRNGKFKFVECKLQYESLSAGQKKCIVRLQQLGFRVEVHKVVDTRTKVRAATVNIDSAEKLVMETQMMIAQRAKSCVRG